ncbi:MAG: hypothetical protein R6V03_05920 [Kiritimatiellia bacterium]
MQTKPEMTDMKWARVCWAIDLVPDGPVVIRAERGRGGLQYSRIPPEQARASLGVLPSGAVTTGCITVRDSLTHRLNVPFSSRTKAMKVLPSMLDIELPFPLESCSYCFLPDASAAAPGSTSSIAVAARTAEITKTLERYRAEGFDPMVLDHEGLALWTQGLAEHPLPAGDETPRVVARLEQDSCTLAAGLGRRFLASYSSGSSDIAQVERFLRVQLPGDADRRTDWIWTGSLAGRGGDPSGLMEKLPASRPGTSTVTSEPEAFAARGLAARVLINGPLACNLRSGPAVHPRLVARARTATMKTALSLAAAGLLLAAMAVGWRAAVKARERTLEAQFQSLCSELAGYEVTARGRDAILTVNREVERRMAEMKPFLRAFSPSLTHRLASAADMAKAYDMEYASLDLADETVSITGTAGDWEACDALLKQLRSYGYSARLDREDPRPQDGRIPFTVSTRPTP